MQFKTCWRSAQSGANLSPREFPATRERYREFSQADFWTTSSGSPENVKNASLLNRGPGCRVYLKYELGVIPKAFLNIEVKALGVA